MERERHAGRIAIAAAAMFAAAAIVVLPGCAAPAPQPPASRFASAEQVELNFLGRRFVLGANDKIAEVRQPSWPPDRFLRVAFWFGINVLVPGVLQPKEGDYYVISEALLVRGLDPVNEWWIDAGSALLKKDAIFVTTRTHYKSLGKVLPTIVQFSGTRDFKDVSGRTVKIPVLQEVSLPMEWTLGGRIPKDYARFQIG